MNPHQGLLIPSNLAARYRYLLNVTLDFFDVASYSQSLYFISFLILRLIK